MRLTSYAVLCRPCTIFGLDAMTIKHYRKQTLKKLQATYRVVFICIVNLSEPEEHWISIACSLKDPKEQTTFSLLIHVLHVLLFAPWIEIWLIRQTHSGFNSCSVVVKVENDAENNFPLPVLLVQSTRPGIRNQEHLWPKYVRHTKSLTWRLVRDIRQKDNGQQDR